MRARLFALLAVALFATATTRDLFNDWVNATLLPPLVIDTSVEVVDRDGALLRAFTVADGRWRLDPGPVDPLFIDMLLAYEDKRFFTHPGVDARALIRAALQSLRSGHVTSGGSTITMQVARLLEDSGAATHTDTSGCKA